MKFSTSRVPAVRYGAGNLVIADAFNQRIRELTAAATTRLPARR